jgi:hypothetical protein
VVNFLFLKAIAAAERQTSDNAKGDIEGNNGQKGNSE